MCAFAYLILMSATLIYLVMDVVGEWRDASDL